VADLEKGAVDAGSAIESAGAARMSGAAAFLVRRRGAFRLLFFGVALFSFVMAVLPHPPHVPGEPSDKVEHMAAFATLSVLAAAAWPRWPLPALGLALSYFGAIIEIVQAIPALHRDCDIMDWVADTAAVTIVLGIAFVLRRVAGGRARR
jgi:hypothetical protein